MSFSATKLLSRNRPWKRDIGILNHLLDAGQMRNDYYSYYTLYIL